MCNERFCGATFSIPSFASNFEKEGCAKSVLHYARKPGFESSNLGLRYKHPSSKKCSEPEDAHPPVLAKTASCFLANVLRKRGARIQVVVLSLYYVTLHCIRLHYTHTYLYRNPAHLFTPLWLVLCTWQLPAALATLPRVPALP